MITLDEAKLHLRVDQDPFEDDAIMAIITAATWATADYLNMAADDLGPDAPAPVKAATLLMIGDLYENRGRQDEKVLYGNCTYERLLNPYRAMKA